MSKKRSQKQKPRVVRNEQYMKDIQELRRSNAAGIHRSPKSYRRKPKYPNRWED